MPQLRQEMNLTVSEILNYQDLDGSEQDSCSEDWSDLGLETSKLDSPPNISIQYLEPSSWLEGYLIGNDGLSKSCRGVTSRDGTRFYAGPPVYSEHWTCVECHYSHVQFQVECTKCGAWFGYQDRRRVLKSVRSNCYYTSIY
ncbi:hypothetical protein K435DRAFT_776716 [Dendrothele bispora CBS 962.96]|uniref:RanBP2-type domain-containing protein n=1 Tax=Dendrothele bispora (strain CBS 962.96) TaxID=1314807 RepID=A0A4S8MCA4_DENBC|nr:hypothetical protein K435DRAFT_776716 [Dendrothele bispora CBS 962.96]